MQEIKFEGWIYSDPLRTLQRSQIPPTFREKFGKEMKKVSDNV